MRDARIIDVNTATGEPYEDDVEAAFNEWRQGFDDSESPGHIRAFRIPLDEQGHASHSAANQVRLGMWPIDQYDFDTLCAKLMRDYMLPTETQMAVRLIGTLTGKSGVRFNKIVVMQRPNTPTLPGAAPKDAVSEIMRSMQESQERMMRLFSELRPAGSAPGGGSDEMMRTIAMMRALMEPQMQMMGPLLAAIAGRPVSSAPSGSIKETIETMMLMDKFLGRRGGGNGPSEPDWVKVTTAVAGVAKPLLELASAKQLESTRTRRPRIAQTAPVQPVQGTAPASGMSTPPATAPVSSPVTTGVDLSRPSPLPQGSLSPGPNIDAPSSTLTSDQAMFAEKKKQVDALVEVAATGVDPVLVANEFFQSTMMDMEEKDYGKLCAAIESDGFLGSIGIYNTRVAQFTDFFTRMRARLIELITAEDSAGD